MIESAAVIGCGSIGQRHLQNLRRLGVRQLVAVDTDERQIAAVARTLESISTFRTVDDALARRVQAVIIAVPPHQHVAIAQAAIAAGADVFIEKPISDTLEGVDALIREAESSGRIVAVGYNLRFHAGVARLKALVDSGAVGVPLIIRAEFGQYLPDWRPTQDYRVGYNAHRNMGGGIILDASHELDYVIWIGGPVVSVFCAAGRLSQLDIDVEDSAAITARLRSGAIAEIHVDSIQRQYVRTCKVIGENGTLFWQYGSGITWLRPGSQSTEEYAIVPDPNEMYLAELRHFLACVRRDETPLVDARIGAEVLKVAIAAHKSAGSGCTVPLA